MKGNSKKLALFLIVAAISIFMAVAMGTPAMAGEDPYIGIVGNDAYPLDLYISLRYQQFMFDQELFGVPVCAGSFPSAFRAYGTGCEQFRSQGSPNRAEVCWSGVLSDSVKRLKNAVTRAGNSGWYEWYIRLPKKPSGEINLVLQCGVVKPGGLSVEPCAAEMGERVGPNCTRTEVDPGTNPLITRALPTITAIAFPGLYNNPFAPFNLTAFRNPGSYSPFSGVNMVNGAAAQLLNDFAYPNDTKIVLKACMDKTIITKLPVTGQVNATGDVETDLEYGDMIYVRLDIPRYNSVDIYCHKESLKVVGVGETWF